MNSDINLELVCKRIIFYCKFKFCEEACDSWKIGKLCVLDL